MSSAICFNLDLSKILSSGNGLINPVLDDKSLALSSLKAFVNEKLNVT